MVFGDGIQKFSINDPLIHPSFYSLYLQSFHSFQTLFLTMWQKLWYLHSGICPGAMERTGCHSSNDKNSLLPRITFEHLKSFKNIISFFSVSIQECLSSVGFEKTWKTFSKGLNKKVFLEFVGLIAIMLPWHSRLFSSKSLSVAANTIQLILFLLDTCWAMVKQTSLHPATQSLSAEFLALFIRLTLDWAIFSPTDSIGSKFQSSYLSTLKSRTIQNFQGFCIFLFVYFPKN